MEKAHVGGPTVLHMMSEGSWIPEASDPSTGVLFKQFLGLVAIYPDLGLSLQTGHRWDGIWKVLELSADAGCSNTQPRRDTLL